MTVETSVYKFPSPVDAEAPNGPAQIKALADKLEVTKWLSPNLKPTVAVKQASAGLTLTGSLVDVPGASVSITPTVASSLFVVVSAHIVTTGFAEGKVFLNLDGVNSERAAIFAGPNGAATVVQVHLLSLTAAAHTIKLQGLKTGEVATVGTGSCFLYALFAS